MKSISSFLTIYINSFLLCFVSILSIFLKRKPGERLWLSIRYKSPVHNDLLLEISHQIEYKCGSGQKNQRIKNKKLRLRILSDEDKRR